MAKREMRIGTTLLGQEAPLRLKVFRPIHFIGKSSPRIVLTRSPILRSSIRASPRAVTTASLSTLRHGYGCES